MKKLIILIAAVLFTVCGYSQTNITSITGNKITRPAGLASGPAMLGLRIQNSVGTGDAGIMLIVGTDTVIMQLASNGVFYISDASVHIQDSLFADNGLLIQPTDRVTLDGGAGHTYLTESASDVSSYFVGGVEALTIVEATNIILGIDKANPDGVHSDYTALQLGGNTHMTTTRAAGDNAVLHLTHNANFDTDGSWEYISTDEASRYRQTSGQHDFYVVASGAAGSDITWIRALTIEINGDVTAAFNLDVANNITVDNLTADSISVDSINIDSRLTLNGISADSIIPASSFTGNLGNSTTGADTVFASVIQSNSAVSSVKDSLVTKCECSNVVDDGTIVLPDATTQNLIIWVDGDDEWGLAAIQADGTVTLPVTVGSVVNTDTDTNLCIFDSGTGATIKNRLGSSKVICYETKYKL